MGRKKNIDIYNDYVDLIRRQSDKFLKEFNAPEHIYKIGRDYEIEDVDFELCANWFLSTKSNSKVTKKDIEWIKKIYERGVDESNISINVDHGYRSYKGFIENDRVAFNREDLLELSEELKDKYIAKEGQINCDYCKIAVDEDKSVKNKVISYANYGSAGRYFEYCSSKCASYDQMAHEG